MMIEASKNGGQPINWARTWEQDTRQKKKELQGRNWYRQGGYDVPLFVPHTPGGELAIRMRAKEQENNQGRTIRFKIIEKGGVTLDKKLRRSNPWAGGKCGRDRCFPCQGPKGGNCWREGGEILPMVRGMWGEGSCLPGRDREEWVHQRERAPGEPGVQE